MEDLSLLLKNTQSQVSELTNLVEDIQFNVESNQMSIIKNIELLGQITNAVSKNMSLIMEMTKAMKKIDDRLKEVESFYLLSVFGKLKKED